MNLSGIKEEDVVMLSTRDQSFSTADGDSFRVFNQQGYVEVLQPDRFRLIVPFFSIKLLMLKPKEE